MEQGDQPRPGAITEGLGLLRRDAQPRSRPAGVWARPSRRQHCPGYLGPASPRALHSQWAVRRRGNTRAEGVGQRPSQGLQGLAAGRAGGCPGLGRPTGRSGQSGTAWGPSHLGLCGPLPRPQALWEAGGQAGTLCHWGDLPGSSGQTHGLGTGSPRTGVLETLAPALAQTPPGFSGLT